MDDLFKVIIASKFLPQKKEWTGLTEEEIMASLPSALRAPPLKMPPGWRQFADAIEAVLKEKNYG